MSGQAGRGGGENGGGGPDAELADDVVHHLQSLGCFVEPSWVRTWLAQPRSSTGGGGGVGAGAPQAQELARICLAHVLEADLRTVGAPALPPQVGRLQGTTLPGQLLLQVEEVSDIGVPMKHRYGRPAAEDGSRDGDAGAPGAAPPSQRCLKLLLTDGHQQLSAFEYRPVPQLGRDLVAGAKVVLRDAPVRRGMVLLFPEVVQVLGGQVAHLEAARQRMLKHLVEARARPALTAERIQRQRRRERQGQVGGEGGGGGGAQTQHEWAAAAVHAAWPEEAPNGAAEEPRQSQHEQPQQQHQQQQQQQQQQRRRQPQQQQNQHQQPQQRSHWQQQQAQQEQQENQHQQQGVPHQQPHQRYNGEARPSEHQHQHSSSAQHEQQEQEERQEMREPQPQRHTPQQPLQHGQRHTQEQEPRPPENHREDNDSARQPGRQPGGFRQPYLVVEPEVPTDRVSRWLEAARAAHADESPPSEQPARGAAQETLGGIWREPVGETLREALRETVGGTLREALRETVGGTRRESLGQALGGVPRATLGEMPMGEMQREAVGEPLGAVPCEAVREALGETPGATLRGTRGETLGEAVRVTLGSTTGAMLVFSLHSEPPPSLEQPVRVLASSPVPRSSSTSASLPVRDGAPPMSPSPSLPVRGSTPGVPTGYAAPSVPVPDGAPEAAPASPAMAERLARPSARARGAPSVSLAPREVVDLTQMSSQEEEEGDGVALQGDGRRRGEGGAAGAPGGGRRSSWDLAEMSSQEDEEEGDRVALQGEGRRRGEAGPAPPGHARGAPSRPFKTPRQRRLESGQEEDVVAFQREGWCRGERGRGSPGRTLGAPPRPRKRPRGSPGESEQEEGPSTAAAEPRGGGLNSAGAGGAPHVPDMGAVCGTPHGTPSASRPVAAAGAAQGPGAIPLLYLADVLRPPPGQGAAHGPSAAGRRAEGGPPGTATAFKVKCAVISVKSFRPSPRLSITVNLDDGVTVAAAYIPPQEAERIMYAAGAPSLASSSGSGPPSQGRAAKAHLKAFLASFEGIAHVSASAIEDAQLTVHRLLPGCESIDLPELLARVQRATN